MKNYNDVVEEIAMMTECGEINVYRTKVMEGEPPTLMGDDLLVSPEWYDRMKGGEMPENLRIIDLPAGAKNMGMAARSIMEAGPSLPDNFENFGPMGPVLC